MTESAIAPVARVAVATANERARVEAKASTAMQHAEPKIAVPRHNIEAERAVLGAVLLRNDTLPIVSMRVKAEDFYVPAHASVFECMLALGGRDEPIDVLTLSTELGRRKRLNAVGGMQFLGELVEATPTTAHAETHAQLVAELATVRRIGSLGATLVERALDPAFSSEQLQAYTTESLARVARTRAASNCVALGAELEALYADLGAEADPHPPRSTGLRDLDAQLGGGVRDEQLIIIAARPAQGKSSLAQQIAARIARTLRHVCLFFSLEMGRRELVLRLLAAEADVDAGTIRARTWSDEEGKAMSDAGARIYDIPLIFNDTKELSVSDIRAIALQQLAKAPEGIGCIVVDYLQLLQLPSSRDDNRARQIGDATRALKILAGVIACPVIVLSQLNRDLEKRPNKRPLLADLRESGSIEQDADIVVFVYRDETYNKDSADKGIAELIVAKQRGGAIGTVRTRFRAERTSFLDLDPNDDPRLADVEPTSHPQTARRRGRRSAATPLEEDRDG